MQQLSVLNSALNLPGSFCKVCVDLKDRRVLEYAQSSAPRHNWKSSTTQAHGCHSLMPETKPSICTTNLLRIKFTNRQKISFLSLRRSSEKPKRYSQTNLLTKRDRFWIIEQESLCLVQTIFS